MPRFLVAAFITGGLGYYIPYAMGTDLSAIGFSISENHGLQILLGLLIAKVLMTISALGLGIPGGIIGPILGIGAVAGTCASAFATNFLPGDYVLADYALMGMAGFMAATLNAPLAALLAIVELSNQLEIIVPAMIVIASSCVASGQFFKNRSVIIMQLEVQNLVYRTPPIEKSLQRIGVLGVMQENIEVLTQTNDKEFNHKIESVNEHKHAIVRSSTVNCEFTWFEKVSDEANEKNTLIKEHPLIPLAYQATLADAYSLLVNNRQGGVYIYQEDKSDIIGIVSFEQIKKYLLEGKTTL